MKNHFYLIAIFCLISNVTCSMQNRQRDLSSCQSISLTQENQNRLLSFIKEQLVQQGQLPDNANLKLKAFVLDKDCRDPKLGQGYIIAIEAKWFTYESVRSERGVDVFRRKLHDADIDSHIFKSGLDAAGVNLPK
jgi:hypothetical protein